MGFRVSEDPDTQRPSIEAEGPDKIAGPAVPASDPEADVAGRRAPRLPRGLAYFP